MIAIILAAGRGSRLKKKTFNKPKCLIKIHNKSILEWSIESIKQSGIKKIFAIGGYKHNELKKFINVKYVNNNWKKTNIFYSLLKADKTLMKKPSLIFYSDILFNKKILRTLINNKSQICIPYDKSWKKLWKIRFKDPFQDAETFVIKNKRLFEIGKKTTNMKDIQGQFMGILKITPPGWKKIKMAIKNLTNSQISKIDITSLLNYLIQKKVKIDIAPILGKWCEIDSSKDLEIYKKKTIKKNVWSHDWR